VLIPSSQTESAVLSAPTLMDPRFLKNHRHLWKRETMAPREMMVPLVLLAEMESPDNLVFLAHPAPLAPLALAETSLLK